MLMHTLLMLVGVGNVVSQSIKLVPGPSEGRLEVNYNGTWGTVCQSSFANQASAVVCRSLNQPANHSYWVYGSVYGTAQVNPLLSYVSCTGTENSIFDCSLTPAVPNRSCPSASYIVSIICTNEKLPVRFRYGSTWINPQQTVNIFEKDTAYCCAGNGTQPKGIMCDVRQNGYISRGSCCRGISTSRRSYGGQANCSVIHWQYEETASIFLNILYTPESFMTSDVKILEYSSVNVSLVNLPNPLPYLTTWRKTGTRLTWNQTEAYRNYRSISRLDSGEFLVNITNRMVSSRGVVREAWGLELLHIDVLYKPTVSCPREYVVVKGGNINITCSIDSNPAPHLYIWTNSRGDSVQQGTQPTLTLTAVGPGTTGRYKCTAINKMESTTGAMESGIGFGDVLVTIGDQTQVLPGVTGTERSTEAMSTNTPLQTRDDNTYLYILIAFGVVALVVTVVLVVVVIRMRKALKENKGGSINRDEVTEREGRVQYAAESDYTSLEPPAEANINGVPACANKKLLTDIVRGEWNFTGYVAADAGALVNKIQRQHYFNNTVDAAAGCLNAGCGLEVQEGNLRVYDSIIDAIHQNKVSEAFVREQMKPLLYTRLRLGEFDPRERNPYNYLDIDDVVLSSTHRQLAVEAAVKSFVLLKNINSFLPIKTRYNHIAVVGPMANDSQQVFGDYAPSPDPRHITSPLSGLVRLGTTAAHAAGCSSTFCTDYSKTDVVKALQGADVVFVCLGTGQAIEGEGKDRHNISLPGQQLQLLQDVVSNSEASSTSPASYIEYKPPLQNPFHKYTVLINIK